MSDKRIQECRKTAAEILRRLEECDIELTQLETLHGHLESAKRSLEKSTSEQEQSTDTLDDSPNTKDIDCQNDIKETLEEGSEEGKYTIESDHSLTLYRDSLWLTC